jgi:hypothetical protein
VTLFDNLDGAAVTEIVGLQVGYPISRPHVVRVEPRDPVCQILGHSDDNGATLVAS